MKILNAGQIRALDQYTIKNEPIPSIELMERASNAFVHWFINNFDPSNKILIFCGTGNNGGDGLAIGRILINIGYSVDCYIVRFSDNASHDFRINEAKLKKISELREIRDENAIPKISGNQIIIDAIFGSGLSRPINGFTARLVKHLNNSENTTVSVDIPSGLYCDSYNKDKNIIKADFTITFQLPKLSFLLPQNEQYVGEWFHVDIGLDQKFINKAKTPYHYVEKSEIKNLFKARRKFSHKGTFGHVLLIAGSYGKIGAAVLGGKAALRTGSGLVSLHIPKCGYEIVQISVPEIMCQLDKDKSNISKIPKPENFTSIGIGPGIGQEEKILKALTSLIKEVKFPIVFDADAINLIGANKNLLKDIPENSIFTPHPKEFERLVGKSQNNYERLGMIIHFCKKYKVFLVLKGAHTAIGTPQGDIFFNSTGNPGMATAGSGDVLTGIILSLLGQGYPSQEATILGVFLHGLAGDLGSQKEFPSSLIASDIIKNIGNAYKKIMED
ncbi:bifunctional ADP-dependent NAD(P)H-hydrate dehydratase/NAD(P)H-hydrate epimerase [Flexithrix dorotheae]|uniref:bifunctional ADP-dependent NAD(P)H-hydrate dehydratase/NAD(P)H-hydrate epimerase n=1 Tax=Flexithrix dorotheae TaxID=70993 RepID=UPI0003690A82|nr:bifunctional ADP-dependent NAD(P)H-hydrate dehydratase/NAD(P)H-hydrate epimerase [Flexithrix dorotheae]